MLHHSQVGRTLLLDHSTAHLHEVHPDHLTLLTMSSLAVLPFRLLPTLQAAFWLTSGLATPPG